MTAWMTIQYKLAIRTPTPGSRDWASIVNHAYYGDRYAIRIVDLGPDRILVP